MQLPPLTTTVKYKEDELIVPENFARVEPGVYRSSFPRSKNIPFLKTLGLKSVISLVPEEYPVKMVDFYNQMGITLRPHGLEGNKWPFKGIDGFDLQKTMEDVMSQDCRPLLIHCNKGKHRTGTVVGCLRKIRGWSLTSIFQEYLFYAMPKTRLEDQRMIEAFEFEVNSFVPNDAIYSPTCDESFPEKNHPDGNNSSIAEDETRSEDRQHENES